MLAVMQQSCVLEGTLSASSEEAHSPWSSRSLLRMQAERIVEEQNHAKYEQYANQAFVEDPEPADGCSVHAVQWLQNAFYAVETPCNDILQRLGQQLTTKPAFLLG